MARDVYTADMGQPPSNDDMMSIEKLQMRGKPSKGMDAMAAKALAGKMGAKAPMMGAKPRPNPADAGIFTADKGIAPPSPDEGPTLDRGMRGMPRRPGMKKGGCVKKAAGGKVGSASKRADGCCVKGKTKGRMI